MDDSVKTVFALLVFVPILVLYIWSIVWAYSDAENRGKSGCLVALMVMLISWPVGILIWLVFRPEGRGERLPRE